MLPERGQVITACGAVRASSLGRVLMHEHLHADFYDVEQAHLVVEERPIAAERRELLLREAVPQLRECTKYGGRAFVEATPAPSRAWPTFYAEVSELTGLHVVLCTGFYREVELGAYWVKHPGEKPLALRHGVPGGSAGRVLHPRNHRGH